MTDGVASESGHASEEPAITLRHYEPGDEHELVDLLARCDPAAWAVDGHARWRWLYGDRPGFTPSDIRVACYGTRIVGCTHTAAGEWVWGDGTELVVASGTDLAVDPDFRRHGLALKLVDAQLEVARENGVMLHRGNAASEDLRTKLYGPYYGYRLLPTEAVEVQKVVTVRAYYAAIRGATERMVDDKGRERLDGYSFDVAQVGLDALRVSIGAGKVSVGPAGASPAPIRFEVPRNADLRTLFGHPQRSLGRILRSLWLLLRIRPRGLMRHPAFARALAAAMARRLRTS